MCITIFFKGGMVMDNMNMQKRKLGAQRVVNFLINKGIEIPPNLVEKEIGKERAVFLYSEKDVKELLKVTAFWRPFVGEREYNDFVVNVTKMFLRTQCISICNNPECHILFVGDYCSGELEGIALMKELVFTRMSRGGNAVSDSTKYPIG